MLKINNLTFSYGKQVVFTDLSFNLKKKESLCIVGPNGSGKTTLLKILCGLNYCPGLVCKLDNSALRQEELKKLVCYIPAAPNFYEDLTQREYIIWLRALWKMDADYPSRVDQYLELLNLQVDEQAEISTYSLGMKYKLYFCAFLALQRPILLLDEPLNSLDINSREVAISIIREYLEQKNGYCFFSSHVKDTIQNLADRIIEIKNESRDEIKERWRT